MTSLLHQTAAARIQIDELTVGQRGLFMAKVFGNLFFQAEALLFTQARDLVLGATDFEWVGYSLSNGAHFLAPATGYDLELNIENGFRGTVSAEAAGIIISLYVFSQLSQEHVDTDIGNRMDTLFFRLREYGLQHPERRSIMQAID